MEPLNHMDWLICGSQTLADGNSIEAALDGFGHLHVAEMLQTSLLRLSASFYKGKCKMWEVTRAIQTANKIMNYLRQHGED